MKSIHTRYDRLFRRAMGDLRVAMALNDLRFQWGNRLNQLAPLNPTQEQHTLTHWRGYIRKMSN